MKFLSTPSARRATGRGSCRCQRPMYFYPRPPRGGRPALPPGLSSPRYISIHALREEGDGAAVRVLALHSQFLSTPSARRATHRRPAPGSRGSDFYPRPPRGGRPPARSDPRSGSRISIHALREEGDRCGGGKGKSPADFYPRPPRGGRPLSSDWIKEGTEFLSTPSARRATLWTLPRSGQLRDFYPRPPRGGRPGMQNGSSVQLGISIHALREEGDDEVGRLQQRLQISIHALREEGDLLEGFLVLVDVDFYPRPPRGGRPGGDLLHSSTFHDFYPRPPRGGRRDFTLCCLGLLYFYPRPPRGGRPGGGLFLLPFGKFLSTPSARRATGVSLAVAIS